MRTLVFAIATVAAGVLSIGVAVFAAYLAWLTRRAVAMGATSVTLPLTRRRLVPPSVAVMVLFAACFLAIGAGLIALGLTA